MLARFHIVVEHIFVEHTTITNRFVLPVIVPTGRATPIIVARRGSPQPPIQFANCAHLEIAARIAWVATVREATASIVYAVQSVILHGAPIYTQSGKPQKLSTT